MQLTEVAVSTILAGGIAGTAKAARAYVAPHAGLIGVGLATSAVAVGAGIGGNRLGERAIPSVTDQRSKLYPSTGPGGLSVTGSVVAGIAALGAGAGLVFSSGIGSRGKFALAVGAAGLGAAAIGSTVGMVRQSHAASADIAAWRAAHPDQLQKPKVVSKPAHGSNGSGPADLEAYSKLTNQLYNSAGLSSGSAASWATDLTKQFGAEDAAKVGDAAARLYNESGASSDNAIKTSADFAAKNGTAHLADFTAMANNLYNQVGASSGTSLSTADRLLTEHDPATAKAIVATASQLYNSSGQSSDAAIRNAEANAGS